MAIGRLVCGQLEIVERLSNWMDVIFSALEGVYLVFTSVVSSQPWWLSSFLHARYDGVFLLEMAKPYNDMFLISFVYFGCTENNSEAFNPWNEMENRYISFTLVSSTKN